MPMRTSWTRRAPDGRGRPSRPWRTGRRKVISRPSQLRPRRAKPNQSRSEVRLVRDRDVVVEQMLVVLGAGLFVHRPLDPPEIVDRRPRLIEGVRILDPQRHLERLAVV